MTNFFKFLVTTAIIFSNRKKNQAIDFEVRGQQNKKILVIAFDAIGDFIISSTTLQQINKKFGNAEIDFLASDRNADLARRSGWFKKVWAVQLNSVLFDRDNWRIVHAIRDTRYHLVINLFDEPDDVALAKMLVIAKHSQFISLNIREKSKFQKLQMLIFKGFFSNKKFFAYPVQSGSHFLERMNRICDFWSMNIVPDFKYTFPNISSSTASKTVDMTGKYYFHPFGSQKNNCLDLGIIKSITETLGEKNFVVPGIRNKFNGDDLKKIYPNSPEFKSFHDLAATVQNCKAIISVDTATAHLAVALGKPLFLIRANEDWRAAFDPRVGKFLIFKSDNTKIESLDLLRLQAELKKFLASLA